jgi:DNA-binding XRE family transcriptional regulator
LFLVYETLFIPLHDMPQMNLTPLDDVLDKHFGKVGTPKRDAFERDVDEALHANRLGEAIRNERIRQNLTQEELGERVGVKRAQISRLEKGYSITIPTMRKVFCALGVTTATIDLGTAGKVALW